MPYNRIEIIVQYKGNKKESPIIDNTNIATTVIRNISNHNTILWREEAFILCLNSANKLLGWYKIASGGMESIHIDSKIIATIALKCIATGIILTHNHPGGNPQPTNSDIQTTMHVKEVMDIIGITLLDHIIISDHDHFSMKENGIL